MAERLGHAICAAVIEKHIAAHPVRTPLPQQSRPAGSSPPPVTPLRAPSLSLSLSLTAVSSTAAPTASQVRTSQPDSRRPDSTAADPGIMTERQRVAKERDATAAQMRKKEREIAEMEATIARRASRPVAAQ